MNDGYNWNYEYDIMGRVTQQKLVTPFLDGDSLPLAAKAAYTYNSDGQLANLYYPGVLDANPQSDSNAYSLTYDGFGREQSSLQGVASYNAAGQILSLSGLGGTQTNTYEALTGRLTRILGVYASQTKIDLNYAYRDDGRVSAVTDVVNPGQSATYGYDNLNRLASASTPNWGLSWTYDDFGNRLAQTGTLPQGPLTYEETINGELVNRNRINGYTYDLNGNLTTMPGTPSTTMAYDVFDRAVTITKGSGTTQAKYDAYGRRIEQTLASGAKRIYFYGLRGQLLAEYDGNLWGFPLGQAAARANYYLAGKRLGYFTDRTGSVRFTLAGQVYSHYYPYGEEIVSTTNDTYKFAELYRDSDTGLDYAVNRYSNSSLGRFLTADPYQSSGGPGDPQSWNRYPYVQNDPINYYDPSGTNLADPNAPVSPEIRVGLGLIDHYGPEGPFTSVGVVISTVTPPSPVGSTGGSGYTSGITNALNGLQTISLGGFKSNSDCRDFFGALIKGANLSTDIDTLMNQLSNVANDAMLHGSVYDGPSSTTALDPDKFPGAASEGVSTVGQWFGVSNDRQALSQFNGSAIWIKQGQWEGGILSPFVSGLNPNQYGLGTLMHELLHKQGVGGGFTHDQMAAALNSVQAPPGTVGQANIASRIGKSCF